MESRQKTKIGVIGCGKISSVYLASPALFAILDIVACADIDLERARAQAERHHIPRACSVEELLSDPEIEIVINLTIPRVHAEITRAILSAGKHAYSEKPLALTRSEGQELLALAEERHLRIGCAPDTFLGGGLQTCIELVNQGQIGVPIGATAFMMNHGPEHWHPDPDFYYQPGAGPLFDMGPYYLNALISILGPVRRVSGSTSTSFSERLITSQPKHGTKITVNTPTHLASLLDFSAGAVATLITSFDVWQHALPHVEIYGTEGTLSLPDPNTFGGPVLLRRAHEDAWREIPLTHDYTQNCRGIGIADMAHALHSGRVHRANGELALHVLDIMQAIHESSSLGRHIELTSSCERPAPLSAGTHTWNEDYQPPTTHDAVVS